MSNERIIEILFNILMWSIVAIVMGLIALVLWFLPKPIFWLLVVSTVLGCIVGLVDILTSG